MDVIDSATLYEKLTAAGIAVDGCDSSGRIDFKPATTAEQRRTADQIVADLKANPPIPKLTLEERVTALEAQIALLIKEKSK